MFLDHDAAIEKVLAPPPVWHVTLSVFLGKERVVVYEADSHDLSLIGTLGHALYGYSVRHGDPQRVEEVQIRRVEREAE